VNYSVTIVIRWRWGRLTPSKRAAIENKLAVVMPKWGAKTPHYKAPPHSFFRCIVDAPDMYEAQEAALDELAKDLGALTNFVEDSSDVRIGLTNSPPQKRNPKVSHIVRFEIYVELQKARFAARQTPALDLVYRYVKDVMRDSLGRDVRLNVDRFPGHDSKKRAYLLWCMLPAAHAKLIRFPRHELVGLRLMLRSHKLPRLLAFAV